MLTGKHLIAGDWIGNDQTFTSSPAHGPSHQFSIGTPAHVATACEAAEAAFLAYSAKTRAERAAFLNRIADEIEARGAEISSFRQDCDARALPHGPVHTFSAWIWLPESSASKIAHCAPRLRHRSLPSARRPPPK